MSPRSSRFPVPPLAALLVTFGCERAPTNHEWSSEDDPVTAATLVAAEPGMPVPGLTAAQLALFERGRLIFEKSFTDAEGLGPSFNAQGCVRCHNGPVTGGFSGRGVTHATAWDPPRCDDLSAVGGPVFQENFTDAAVAAFGDSLERPDARATAIAERSTPDLFGFGLLDAIPEQTLQLLARQTLPWRDAQDVQARAEPSRKPGGQAQAPCRGPRAVQRHQDGSEQAHDASFRATSTG